MRTPTPTAIPYPATSAPAPAITIVRNSTAGIRVGHPARSITRRTTIKALLPGKHSSSNHAAPRGGTTVLHHKACANDTWTQDTSSLPSFPRGSRPVGNTLSGHGLGSNVRIVLANSRGVGREGISSEVVHCRLAGGAEARPRFVGWCPSAVSCTEMPDKPSMISNAGAASRVCCPKSSTYGGPNRVFQYNVGSPFSS